MFILQSLSFKLKKQFDWNLLLLALSFSLVGTLNAQNTGVVVNSETLEPISFVNIQIEGSLYGGSTDLNGRFNLELDDGKTVLFSAIGFENKKLLKSELSDQILMTPIAYPLEEVTISAEEKEFLIGKLKKRFYTLSYGNCYAGDVIAFKFPFLEKYSETAFINQLGFVAYQDEVENPIFNLRILEVDSTGAPGEPIHQDQIRVEVKKDGKLYVNLKDQYLRFPKNGLYVAIEWLAINQNSFISRWSDTVTCYAPSFLCTYKDQDQECYRLKAEGWTKLGDHWFDRPIQIEITLTN